MNWKRIARRAVVWAGYATAVASTVADVVPGPVGVVAGVIGGFLSRLPKWLDW